MRLPPKGSANSRTKTWRDECLYAARNGLHLEILMPAENEQDEEAATFWMIRQIGIIRWLCGLRDVHP